MKYSLKLSLTHVLGAAVTLVFVEAVGTRGVASPRPAADPQQADRPTRPPGGTADENGPPSAQEPPPPPTITPEARQTMEQMRDAYRNLKAAELNGTIWAKRPAGSTNGEDIRYAFSSAYQAPNRFKHDLQNQLVIGSTGDKVYVYQKPANAYLQMETPPEGLRLADLPPVLLLLLRSQNPSLLLALMNDPVAGLSGNMREISRVEDTVIDGVRYEALALVPHQRPDHRITILVEPTTHLVRRFSVEYNPAQRPEGDRVPPASSAVAEIDYPDVKTDADFKPDFFQWTPPEGARDLTAEKEQGEPAGR